MARSKFDCILKYVFALFKPGGPEAPSSLNFSDVTSNSVTLHWTSGYDMGYQQFFFVFKWDGYQLVRVYNEFTTYLLNH